MSRKQLIEEQFKEARRQYEAGELPLDEDNATANWPLHKYAVHLYNDEDGSPELLEVFLEHAVAGVLRYEDLADNAVELERRHFPHVAEILWKVAENATLHRLGVVLWHAIASRYMTPRLLCPMAKPCSAALRSHFTASS